MSTEKNAAPVYLQAEFNVSRQNHRDFKALMKEILPVIFDQYRWELIYAGYPIVGNINRFTQLWKIPDETSVLRVMQAGAVEEGTPPTKTASGASDIRLELFQKLYRELQGIISETTHVLTTSLPHDPTYFGHQGQTLLVDVEGEAFIIDHDRLREHTARDIAPTLEQARGKRWRTWKNNPGLGKGERVERPTQPKPDLNLQSFLNQGALTARLPDQTLLFNLAGIKPRSVFQEEPDFAKEQARRSERDRNTGTGKVEFPQGIKALLISTPWGSIYKLHATDVNAIASRIPADQVAPTARVLAPLIQAQVPLANIPEERDDVIGDGCMCYVINLASFDSALTEKAFGKQGKLYG